MTALSAVVLVIAGVWVLSGSEQQCLSHAPLTFWLKTASGLLALLTGVLVFIYYPVQLRLAVEDKYRELVENAHSIILRLDTQGNITFLNEYAQSFFGYSSEEIIGKNVIGTIFPQTDLSGNDLATMLSDILESSQKYHENEHIRQN